MSFERPHIERMTGYVFGEQPQDNNVVKLNTNENPYPPSPAVGEVLRAFDVNRLRRYPPALADGFRERAAQLHGLTKEQILVTHGGDELLRLAITTFLEPGAPLGLLEPSYSLYPVLAEIHGSPLMQVELDVDWLPPADTARRWNNAGVRLAMMVNPHAPSGRLASLDQISNILKEFRGLLLLDEAYVDFVHPQQRHDSLSLLQDHRNLLFLRTLSKGYSLAGLRFGYGIAHAEIIEPMATKTRDSYNMDALAQTLAEAAINDQQHMLTNAAKVRASRAKLCSHLAQLGLLTVPSEANFVLAEVPSTSSRSAIDLYRQCKEAGVLVRYFAAPRLDNRLRISVGTDEENARLLSILQRTL